MWGFYGEGVASDFVYVCLVCSASEQSHKAQSGLDIMVCLNLLVARVY